MQGQAGLFGGEIPQRDLHGLLKGKAVGAVIAAAMLTDPMNQPKWILALEIGPDLGSKDTRNLVSTRQWCEKRLREAQSAISTLIFKFNRRDIDRVGAHLAIPNDAISG